MASAKPVEKLSFEDALGELETIVRDLETGQAPLEKSIESYERGIALKKRCEGALKDAQVKIEKITQSQDAAVSTTPLDKDANE